MGAEENYKAIRAELDERLSADKRLAAIAEKISAGKADFSDTARYSQIVSHIMGEVISQHIGEITVPLGKQMVCKELLKDHYKAINDILGEVQASVDDKLGIHLKPVKAPFPTERVDTAAHSLEDPTVPEETIKRRARSTTENIANSMHDDYIKENAKTRTQAGLKCYLVRDAGGGCCKWCQALAGRFDYATAPDDIFRRHDNCTCTVTYECGRQRQDVWSKKTWQASEDELKARKEAEAASKPVVNSKEQSKELEARVLDKSGESGIINESLKMSANLQKPPDFSKYEIKEDYDAVKMIKSSIIKNLGISENDVDLTGIKNADVLEPFINQLIVIQRHTNMSFPSIVAADIVDGDRCCISGFKPFENRLYISSRFFNCKEALIDTMKEWSHNGILPKQARSIRYLAEHEAAHIRIPKDLLLTDEAKAIWKKRKLLNDNDAKINEYFADAVAIFRTNRATKDNNILTAINYLEKGGVKI
jgi:hypothetical protein